MASRLILEHEQLTKIADRTAVMSAKDVHISIVVEKGDPLDWPQCRHAALFLTSIDSSPTCIAHAVGSAGDFQFECVEGVDPRESGLFAREIKVGFLKGVTTSTQIAQRLRTDVHVDNTDLEFNCQTWVEKALKVLKILGFISKEMYDKGLMG